MKKDLKETYVDSISHRSSPTGDSSSAGRMKGSRRFDTVNTLIHKGNDIRPTASLGILAAEELGNLPGTETDLNVDSDRIQDPELHGSALRDFIRGEIRKVSKRSRRK